MPSIALQLIALVALASLGDANPYSYVYPTHHHEHSKGADTWSHNGLNLPIEQIIAKIAQVQRNVLLFDIMAKPYQPLQTWILEASGKLAEGLLSLFTNARGSELERKVQVGKQLMVMVQQEIECRYKKPVVSATWQRYYNSLIGDVEETHKDLHRIKRVLEAKLKELEAAYEAEQRRNQPPPPPPPSPPPPPPQEADLSEEKPLEELEAASLAKKITTAKRLELVFYNGVGVEAGELKLHHHQLGGEARLAKLFRHAKKAGGTELEQAIAVGKELSERLKALDDRVELVANDRPRYFAQLKPMLPAIRGYQYLLFSRQRLLRRLGELGALKAKKDQEGQHHKHEEKKQQEPQVEEGEMTPEQRISQAITDAIIFVRKVDPEAHSSIGWEKILAHGLQRYYSPQWRNDPTVSAMSLRVKLQTKLEQLKRQYMSAHSNPETYYDILGLKATATESDIKKAFRKLALKYHPDKNAGADMRFKIVHVAFETLSDESMRRRYDWNKATGKGMLNHHGTEINTLNAVVGRVDNKNFTLDQALKELEDIAHRIAERNGN